MPQYRLAKAVTIPKGTVLRHPAPYPRDPVDYGHALYETAHLAIPMDAAIRDGLVEEIE